MCRHCRSGLHYKESGFDVPSWLQQVSPHSPSVLMNLSAFLLRMKNWTKSRWIHPDHMRAFLQKIATILSSSFFPFFPVGVSPLLPLGPAVWCWAHCWLGMLREGAEWPWGGVTTTGACLHGAQHTGSAGSGQRSSPPSPPWFLLQSFPTCTHKSSIPIFCSSLWLHVRVQQEQN